MCKRGDDVFWKFQEQWTVGCGILFMMLAVAGVILAVTGTITYVSVHSVDMTECLPINYWADVGLCRYCANLFDCSPTYPVKGYITFLFSLHGTNFTITYDDLFCGNSIKETIANGKKAYPPNEWIKCGYKSSRDGHPLHLFGNQYPSDQLGIMIAGYCIVGVCIIIFIAACCCAARKVRNEETEPLV